MAIFFISRNADGIPEIRKRLLIQELLSRKSLIVKTCKMMFHFPQKEIRQLIEPNPRRRSRSKVYGSNYPPLAFRDDQCSILFYMNIIHFQIYLLLY